VKKTRPSRPKDRVDAFLRSDLESLILERSWEKVRSGELEAYTTDDGQQAFRRRFKPRVVKG
jgi:hypothetical protein